MKILVDDLKNFDDIKFDRIFRTYDSAVNYIKKCKKDINCLYLDHDLGLLPDGTISPSGLDLLITIENFYPHKLPKSIILVTYNPVGYLNMTNLLSSYYDKLIIDKRLTFVLNYNKVKESLERQGRI